MDGAVAARFRDEDATEVDRIARTYLSSACGDPYRALAAVIVDALADIDAAAAATVEREGLISRGYVRAGATPRAGT